MARVAVLLIVLLAGSMASAATDRQTRVLPLPPDRVLAIELTIGGVTIEGSDRADVELQIERQAPTTEGLARIPVTINMGFGIRARPTTPLIPIARLKEIGVRRISLPRMLPAAAIQAMTTALALMRQVIETGVPVDRPDLLVGIEEIMALMDYEGARSLEERLLTTDALDRKYGPGQSRASRGKSPG